MSADPSFDELIRQVSNGDEQAAGRLVREFEPIIRRVLRSRLRGIRSRREFDSMDICQSVFAVFFVRVAAGQFDLKEPNDLIKLLLTMTRNKVAEKMRRQHRLRRDSRRTVGAVEELALAGRDPSPSRVVSAKELLDEVRERLSEEERRLVEPARPGPQLGGSRCRLTPRTPISFSTCCPAPAVAKTANTALLPRAPTKSSGTNMATII